MKPSVALLFLWLACATGEDTTADPDFEDLDPDNIITNGFNAGEGLAPYIVYLQFSSSFCGGSIIGNTWVVTASHCTKPFNSVTVHYGSLNRGQGTIRHTVSGNNIFNHPRDDIALIRTPHVNFSNTINRIRLPPLSETSQFVGERGLACGWGMTTTGNSASRLQCVYLPVIANQVCRNTFGDQVVQNQIMCVNTNGGRSICFGDSGGPITARNNQVLIGVSNFVSSRGCTSGDPSGFARLTSHLNWIRQRTGISY